MPAVALSRVGARVVESGPDGEKLRTCTAPAKFAGQVPGPEHLSRCAHPTPVSMDVHGQ
jgi:hypothetical protein